MSIYTELASKGRGPTTTLNIRGFKKVKPNILRIVANTNAVSKKDIMEKVAAYFKGTARVIPQSIMREGSLASFIVVPNTVSVPYNEGAIANNGLRVIHANVFMDEQDSMWEVVGDGDSRRIVRKAEVDLAGTVGTNLARYGSSITAATIDSKYAVVASAGDYVAVYDPVVGVRKGFITKASSEGLEFIGKAGSGVLKLTVDKQQVIASVSQPIPELVAGLSCDDAEKVYMNFMDADSVDAMNSAIETLINAE